MQVFRLLPLVALLVACGVTNHQQPTLYSKYSRYSDTVDASNIKTQYSLYFTPAPLDGESLDDPEVVSHLLFPRFMNAEAEHFEAIQGKAGCLTINGTTDQDEPLTLSLQYAKTADGWLINKILIAYLEDPANLPDKAVCPDELRSMHL